MVSLYHHVRLYYKKGFFQNLHFNERLIPGFFGSQKTIFFCFHWVAIGYEKLIVDIIKYNYRLVFCIWSKLF